MKTLTAALLSLGLLAGPAHAQVKGAQAPDDTVVKELVVVAFDHGPAWWKVTNGDSMVLIMGTPMGPMPEKLKWDHSVLERRMKGAKALILPAAPEWNLGTIFQLWGLRKQVRADAPLEAQLPPADYFRFRAVAAQIGQPVAQYDRFDAAIAGLRLYGAFLGKHDLNGRYTTDGAAERQARRNEVPIQRGRFKLGDAIKTAVADSNDAATGQACVHDILEGLEQAPAKFRAAAEGWAGGDVGAAIDLSDGPNRCWLSLFEGSAKVSMDSEFAAIYAALQTPGKAIALVPMRQLVVKDGILEQLRSRGYTIVDPTVRQGDEE